MDKELIKHVEDFAEIVKRFCIWAENPSKNSDIDMQIAQKLLAELFLNVIDLPDDEFGEDIELEGVSTEQWKTVRNRFSTLTIDGYWTVFDPSENKDETVFSLLSDDLADIYSDIKYGLLLFESGHHSEAIWQWKFNFKTHWGRHLLDAQKVIYSWESSR